MRGCIFISNRIAFDHSYISVDVSGFPSCFTGGFPLQNNLQTRRLQRRSLRLPTRSKSAQTGHLCTTAQAGADPGIFVCRSKFPGLKVGRRS